jgi:hypothetical protein
MSNNFDIFAVEYDDEENVRWLEAVMTLEQAQARLNELAKQGHSRFLILDQRTGLKRFVPDSKPAANGMSA